MCFVFQYIKKNKENKKNYCIQVSIVLSRFVKC